MRFAELDAVTVDGYGTLVRLLDPIPSLARSLAERGIDRDSERVRAAFLAEVAYYRPEAVRGRGPDSLARLRCDCTGVFLDAAGAELEPESFVDDFMAAIRFEAAPGAIEALEQLRGRGLDLAVVSNWDVGLPEHLERIGADRLFSAVVTSAEAGAAKPDPKVFRLALERLAVEPARALHVGDEDEDEQGAAAVGMRFAPAPLATAFAGWS
jgi:HAD superfamily hydrolase (TIGR01509 family)